MPTPTPTHHHHQILQRAASRGPGRRHSLLHSLGRLSRLEGSSWITGLPSRPPFSDSPFHPYVNGQRKVLKKGHCTTSAHTLPTETIKEFRLRLPSPSIQFGGYFNRGGEFPEAPQRKCPMSGNVCFHFLLPSMNPTHSYGLGLDPIHTEANQKHLFPEINLSLGNELYIHLCRGTYTHVLTHARTVCITDQIYGVNPQTGSPEPLGREGNVLVSFKGHLEKSALIGKLSDGWCPVSREKVHESRLLQNTRQHLVTAQTKTSTTPCGVHCTPQTTLRPSVPPHSDAMRIDTITATIFSILQMSKVRLRQIQGLDQDKKARRWQN